MVHNAASPLPHDDGTHGGATAIGGYMYQLFSISADQITGETATTSDPFGDAVIYVHEALDQDAAVFSASDNVKLIQAKYSIHGTENKIGAPELDEIANRLLKAAKDARADGLKVKTFRLISNRGLTSPATKKIQACKRAIKNFKYSSPTKRGILSILDVVLLPKADARKTIETFAESFGLKPEEIEEGCDRLAGKIFCGVAHKKMHTMGLSGLREVFVGNKDAGRLSRPAVDEKLKAELLKMTSDPEGKHIPRRSMIEIMKGNPTRAVFVFIGDGGMGKSASLRDLMEKEVEMPTGSLVRTARVAKHMEIDWAKKCVLDWRGFSRYREDNLTDSIRRLRIANPTRRAPVLTLALDGIDEGVKEQHQDYITALIREVVAIDKACNSMVGQLPEYRLVVTCREEEEFTRYLDDDDDISGLELGTKPPKHYQPILFGHFTPDELHQAVTADAPKLIGDIFKNAKPVAGIGARGTEPALSSIPEIFPHLDFLLDPLIWRAFTTLEPDDKSAVLKRKAAGDRKLGKILIERFCKKTKVRCGWKQSLGLQAVLEGIAPKFKKARTRNRPNFLKESENLGLAPAECFRLFDEALIGGLITGGKKSWQWRHLLIERGLGL
jgi:hypothetical protein